MGTALKLGVAVLIASQSCRNGPPQSVRRAEHVAAPSVSATVGIVVASAPPPVAAVPPDLISRDARAEAESSTAGSPAEITFEGTRLTLHVVRDRCELSFKGGETVRLDLAPPCYVLVWNDPPPRLTHGNPESDGQPVGRKGDAMVWRYPSARDAKVVAIIGDSIAERLRDDSVLKIRQENGYRCAGSLQGVKVVKGAPVATAKWNQVGIFCVETGIDEKDYWMLAHDK